MSFKIFRRRRCNMRKRNRSARIHWYAKKPHSNTLSRCTGKPKLTPHLFSDEAAFNRFFLQTQKGNADTKAGLAEQFLKDRPASRFAPKVLLALGNAQKEKGRLNESIETYARIANGFPVQPEADEATAQLGIQLARLGRSDTASIVFSNYLRGYPKGAFSADVLYENGMLASRDDKPLIA